MNEGQPTGGGKEGQSTPGITWGQVILALGRGAVGGAVGGVFRGLIDQLGHH